ncbi:MAG: hypothetical protein LC772_11315, partial [Chloroflexi bacterium]|nr:hypothetical protein [Chloroflexota bacterium]
DHLTYLDLQDCTGVTDDGLRLLARLPRLEHLNVSGSAITDRGLEVLRSLPLLRSFRMYHQRGVTDAGAENLASCEHLERVDLMGTATGDGAIRALAGKPELRELLAGSEVTDDGLTVLHTVPRFKTWSGGEPEMSLMSALAHPTYLWLNLKAPLTDAGLSNLTGLDGLFALNLFGSSGGGAFAAENSAVTSAGLGHLSGLPRLGWLGCCAGLCDDTALQLIGVLPHLRFLMCQDAVAGDAGFAALSASLSIEYIWGRRCYALTGRGFTALSAMPALRGLSVSCKNVDDEGLSSLPDFPALREFMPMDVPDGGFRHIGRCARLEALHCMYCTETTDAATNHITGLRNLTNYQAWGTQITDRSLEMLAAVSSLEHVLLYKCAGVTDSGLAALSGLPRLREVDLESMPHITPSGAGAFPAAVRVNFSG